MTRTRTLTRTLTGSLLVTVALASAALISLSCGCKPPKAAGPTPEPSASPEPSSGPGPVAERSALLSASSGSYDRFEGTSFQNACGADGDCMASGCGGEVCAAEQVNTTCDIVPNPPRGNCGCVDGLCIWYKGGAPVPTPNLACKGDDDCGDGRSCVKYFGIAGPSGPQFSSCEHVCGDNQACPAGLSCTTIADGPGQVCR